MLCIELVYRAARNRRGFIFQVFMKQTERQLNPGRGHAPEDSRHFRPVATSELETSALDLACKIGHGFNLEAAGVQGLERHSIHSARWGPSAGCRNSDHTQHTKDTNSRQLSKADL